MVRKRAPRRLLYYVVRWVAEIVQLTSTQAEGLNGRCSLERVSGETPDISEYLNFGFTTDVGTTTTQVSVPH